MPVVDITLGATVLPAGLVLDGETDWSPVAQSVDYLLSGAVVVEDALRQGGRPLDLLGGREGRVSWAWMARAAFLALKTAGDVPGVIWTLTLHDGSTHRVTARHDGPQGAWIEGRPVPVVGERAPANPGATHQYIIERIRLLEVPA